MRSKPLGIGGHQSGSALSDDWITPPEIIADLGPFDLDPCASQTQPWPTAAKMYTDSGLLRPWEGYVWLNPPYGKIAAAWLQRLSAHGNGIALIFARTETSWFFKWVWEQANAVRFLRGRLTFYRPDGSKPRANSGAPSILVAYGAHATSQLLVSKLEGQFLCLAGLARGDT